MDGDGALARLRRRRFALALTICLVVQSAPLLATRILPFHDAAGIVGLCGALALRHVPSARIADFYDVDFGPYPSSLYFGWGWAAGAVGVPVDVAFNAFIALFCIAGPVLALAFTLRTFDRRPALALLALPVGWHHQIWYGFLGSAAAVTGLVLAVAFAKRVVERRTLADHLGLAGALFAVAIAHPFSFAVALVLVAPMLVWPAPRPFTYLRVLPGRLAVFLPSALFLGAWARGFFGSVRDGVSPWTRLAHEVRLQRPPLRDDAAAFLQWLGDGYRGGLDDLVPLVGLITLLVFLAVGVRPGVVDVPARRSGWPWVAWAAGMLALGYLLLPNVVHWPTYWWGVRVRCVVPLYLIAILGIRTRARGAPPWALAPAVAGALALSLFMTYDFAGPFRRGILAGFDAAIAAIPPGSSVLAMPSPDQPRYTRDYPYVAQHYVLRAGGRVVPHLRGHPGSYWITLKPPPNAPPWGDPRKFVWNEHALGFDHFLVEGRAAEPFAEAPAGAVQLVSDQGRWRLYRRRSGF